MEAHFFKGRAESFHADKNPEPPEENDIPSFILKLFHRQIFNYALSLC